MVEWKNDEALLILIRNELYTAVIGDICDTVGLRHQFLSQEIQAINIHASVPVMAGRAMTVAETNVFQEPENGLPFGKMLEAIDDLKNNEIYVCAGAAKTYATIGELMCTAMIARGAVGALTDSFIRDVGGIRRLNFQVYSAGFYGQDQRGRGVVSGYRVPVEINGVRINDGDLIVGDIDGVLVVPREYEQEVITKALAKARKEKTVQQKIREGMLASEAFKKYGVL